MALRLKLQVGLPLVNETSNIIAKIVIWTCSYSVRPLADTQSRDQVCESGIFFLVDLK